MTGCPRCRLAPSEYRRCESFAACEQGEIEDSDPDEGLVCAAALQHVRGVGCAGPPTGTRRPRTATIHRISLGRVGWRSPAWLGTPAAARRASLRWLEEPPTSPSAALAIRRA